MQRRASQSSCHRITYQPTHRHGPDHTGRLQLGSTRQQRETLSPSTVPYTRTAHSLVHRRPVPLSYVTARPLGRGAPARPVPRRLSPHTTFITSLMLHAVRSAFVLHARGTISHAAPLSHASTHVSLMPHSSRAPHPCKGWLCDSPLGAHAVSPCGSDMQRHARFYTTYSSHRLYHLVLSSCAHSLVSAPQHTSHSADPLHALTSVSPHERTSQCPPARTARAQACQAKAKWPRPLG